MIVAIPNTETAHEYTPNPSPLRYLARRMVNMNLNPKEMTKTKELDETDLSTAIINDQKF